MLRRYDIHCHDEWCAAHLYNVLIESGIPATPDGIDIDKIHSNPKFKMKMAAK